MLIRLRKRDHVIKLALYLIVATGGKTKPQQQQQHHRLTLSILVGIFRGVFDVYFLIRNPCRHEV